MNMPVWNDMKTLFDQADSDPEVRCIILSGAILEGDERPVFSAGIDLGALMQDLMHCFESDDPSRRAFKVTRMIEKFQGSITSIERCRKPVIAAVTGAAVGGAIDMLSACDMVYS